MNTCIQTYPMSQKERDFDNTVISLRLASAEAVRFWLLMDAVKTRSPYVGKSDVYRELLGLNPPSALTKDEIDFFRTGKKDGRDVEVRVPPDAKNHVKLVIPKPDRRRSADSDTTKKQKNKVA